MNYPEFFINGKINPALINDTGNDNVANIATNLKNNSKLNSNQLRKFYDAFLRIYNSNLNPDEKKVQLLILKANVEYAAGRLKIFEFANFLKDRINLVLSRNEDFNSYIDVLKLHFEALVAYFPKR